MPHWQPRGGVSLHQAGLGLQGPAAASLDERTGGRTARGPGDRPARWLASGQGREAGGGRQGWRAPLTPSFLPVCGSAPSKTEGTEFAGRLGRRSGCPRRAARGVNLDGPGAPEGQVLRPADTQPPPREGEPRALVLSGGAERTQPPSGSAWLRIYLTLTQSTQQMAELRGKRPPRCFLSFAKSSERASFGTRRPVPVKRTRLGV